MSEIERIDFEKNTQFQFDLAADALGLDPENRWFLPLVISGVWLLGVGIWTLIRYLRTNPKPDSVQAGRP